MDTHRFDRQALAVGALEFCTGVETMRIIGYANDVDLARKPVRLSYFSGEEPGRL